MKNETDHTTHSRSVLGRLLREPLLHFLALGALLFGVHSAMNVGEAEEDEKLIRITAAEMEWLKETWTRQWQRPPDEKEFSALVSDYIKEALLEREARELGLDLNDTIVRRRLAQKMEFIIDDTVRLSEPGEEELKRIYHDNSTKFESPARASFTQIYFRTEEAANQAKATLAEGDPEGFGEPSLLEREFRRTDSSEIEMLFGPEFKQQLIGLHPSTDWQGPIPSSYGFHVVRLDEVVPSEPKPFDQVRNKVLEEWTRIEKSRRREDYFAGLMEKYEIVLEDSIPQLLPSPMER